jgi:hypothetical protein
MAHWMDYPKTQQPIWEELQPLDDGANVQDIR